MMRENDKIDHQLIQQLQCKKLSPRATGQITYDLWQNQKGDWFIALSANSTTGCFSAELIAVTKIVEQIKQLKATNKPFYAAALKPLYVGKSANNASFLAAALLDQKAIQFHPADGRLLEAGKDLEAWLDRLQQLAISNTGKPAIPKPTDSKPAKASKAPANSGGHGNDSSPAS